MALWNLSQQETVRQEKRLQEEDEEAMRLARRSSHWYDVRTESGFMERSRRRRPGVLKAQEQYLRDDLHCGIDGCPRCEALANVRIFRPGRRMQRDDAEYIVPDAFALLQCMELLEDDAFGQRVRHLLVLETVLNEALRIAPSRDATRLKNFFRDDSRRMVQPCCVAFFPNQHHVDTFVERAMLPWQDGAAEAGVVPWESQADRDHRAVVKALTWYTTQHVSGSSRVVFMTPEPDSSLSHELRSRLHVQVTTCEELVKKRFHHPAFFIELAENTAYAIREWQQRQLEAGSAANSEYPPHLQLSSLQVEERVQKGELLRGKLDVSSFNPNEAFVRTASAGPSASFHGVTITKVFIDGRISMNRGIHGDDVIVQLLPEGEWQAPRSEQVLVHYTVEDSDAGNAATKAAHVGTVDDPQRPAPASSFVVPTGIVVGIARRSSVFVVATVLSSTVSPGDDHALAIPMDKRISKIRIRSQRMDTLLDKRLKVVIDHWPLDSMYPSGHYTSILGDTSDLSTELSAILVQNEIEEAPFCESSLSCLPDICSIEMIDEFQIQECSTSKRPDSIPLLDWQIPPDQISTRRDLRDTHRVFSVDPPGCQDIDDAMSVTKLPNGNIELGVHIADVSYFVRHDSPLDFEARDRATTVYLVGQRLDMLPAVLSGDLCSLHEYVDRLAMSVIWELDGKTLDVIDDRTWFGRTLIRSCSSMTYEQAHRIVQGMNADTRHHSQSALKPTGPVMAPTHRRGVAGGPIPMPLQRELKGDLSVLTMISRKLAKARGEEGGLDLSRSEVFSLNVSELGDGTNSSGSSSAMTTTSSSRNSSVGVEIVMKESLEIHGTIAELMILANAYVATKIVDAFPTNALLRRHPPPSGPRFDQLIRIAQAKQIEIDASNNYTLQQSLVNAEKSGRADSKTMALLKSLAVRVMSEAEYICANAAEATQEQVENLDHTTFAHYGLGLQYYTHFTSPIRRYADLVVHRQLLAALEMDSQGIAKQILHKNTIATAPPSQSVLPKSLVPSVLADEGEEDEGDFLIDSLLADVDSKLHVGAVGHTQSERRKAMEKETKEDELLFPPNVLVPLSQHLNRKNRNAKQASRSCEELYLALYFSTHTVRTYAIITTLKQNGFLVYVPTYDLRAPVYLRDRDGFVQMDPLLCGVRIVDTQPATGGFANVDSIRLIPQAEIQFDANAETLEVVAPTGSCSFHLLDQVLVQVSCDLSGSNARVPQLQLQLVGRVQNKKMHRELSTTTVSTPASTKSGMTVSTTTNKVPELQRIVQKRSALESPSARQRMASGAVVQSPPRTIYDVLVADKNNTTISPAAKMMMTKKQKQPAATLSSKDKGKASASSSSGMRRRGPGRLVFGDYEPPKTLHYQQKLASYMDGRSMELEDELNINRYGSGSNALGSADEMKRLEREATARMAKLATEKRHDRVTKSKKAGH